MGIPKVLTSFNVVSAHNFEGCCVESKTRCVPTEFGRVIVNFNGGLQ
jgi:hypothetical protein